MPMLETATAVILGLVALGGTAAIVLIARGGDPDADDNTVTQLLHGLDDTEPGRGLPRADGLPAWSLADTISAPMLSAAVAATGVPLPPWRTAPAASGAEQPVVGSQPACPTCQQRRCRPHREGRDCQYDGLGEPTAYAAGRAMLRDGRHTITVRLAAYRRRLRLGYLAQAVQLDPTTYAGKLGRPVQLGRGRVVPA